MGKVAEFMDKVMADEAVRAEFDAVIGVRKEREFSDDDFQKIVGLSKKLGAAVTLDEVKNFISGNGREFSEEELGSILGGLNVAWKAFKPLPPSKPIEWETDTYRCKNCGKTKKVSLSESVSLGLENDCPAGDFLGYHEYEMIE